MTDVSTKPLSGMRDFFGTTLKQRRYAIQTIQQHYEAHAFVPLESPTLESLGVLLGKYGEEGDQLLYRVLKRRDALQQVLSTDDITESHLAKEGLRYDLTVPLARIAANYDLPKYFRRYQIQPVWRADRPAKGRYREFYQCDIDVLGSTHTMAEIEVLSAVNSALLGLGFSDYIIHVNHRALLRGVVAYCGIPADKESDALIALDKKDKIGHDGVRAEMQNRGISEQAARTLIEITEPTPNALNQILETTQDQNDVFSQYIQPAIGELKALLSTLEKPLEQRIRFAPALARGLGYYTGPIFEIEVPGFKGSIGGGGRYDGLVGMFSKNPIPAVGCSLGLERLLVLMQERDLFPALSSAQKHTLLCWNDVTNADVYRSAQYLRSEGYQVEIYPEPARLKKQLQYANKIEAQFAAILGEEECKSGQILLRDLSTGEQNSLDLDG